MARVTTEQLATAAEWLDTNNGEQGEAEACSAVAEWLRAEIQRRLVDAAAREVASATGVRPAQAKHALRAAMAASDAVDAISSKRKG